ncbi:unnamed protein product [Cuscuta epithymum]|uniref:Uncharacterized protein n=1 Tax=Cuscuta epithymum TaxID=186058 RepID=A0AAV0F3Z7_9ASTE|nr:unnamed protein product [Cuscuta epithymum]
MGTRQRRPESSSSFRSPLFFFVVVAPRSAICFFTELFWFVLVHQNCTFLLLFFGCFFLADLVIPRDSIGFSLVYSLFTLVLVFCLIPFSYCNSTFFSLFIFS